jgi:hypothetical protein
VTSDHHIRHPLRKGPHIRSYVYLIKPTKQCFQLLLFNILCANAIILNSCTANLFPMVSACLHELVKNFMLYEIKWILMEENHVGSKLLDFFSLNEKLDKVPKPSVSLGSNDKVCCFLLNSIYFTHLLKCLVIVDVVLDFVTANSLLHHIL